MLNFLKQNRKTILIVIITLIAVANVSVILVSFVVDHFRQSAQDIVGKAAVDKVSFCVEKDYFKDIPPFSYEGVETAVENNFFAFLLDVYSTKDNQIVCSPDENLEKIIGIDGKIKDHTYYDLLNYNLVCNGRETSEPIFLCDDIIRHCTEIALTPVIFPHETNSIKTIENILKAYEYSDSMILMSDDFDYLYKVLQKYPTIELWYKAEKVTDEVIENFNLMPNVHIIFDAENKKNDSDIIDKLKKKNIAFGCYNVNKRSVLKKYISLGASNIITSKFVKSR